MLNEFLKKNITSQAGYIQANGYATARSSLTTSLDRQQRKYMRNYLPIRTLAFLRMVNLQNMTMQIAL